MKLSWFLTDIIENAEESKQLEIFWEFNAAGGMKVK